MLNKTKSLTGVTVSENLRIIGFSPTFTDTTFNGASLKEGVDDPYTQYGGGVVYFYQAPGVTTMTNSSFIGNTVETDTLDAYAGAFFDKGTSIDLNDVTFTGNKATVKSANAMAWGGAIYADAAINDEVGVKEAILNFNVTKDMTYSGNTMKSRILRPGLMDMDLFPNPAAVSFCSTEILPRISISLTALP